MADEGATRQERRAARLEKERRRMPVRGRSVFTLMRLSLERTRKQKIRRRTR